MSEEIQRRIEADRDQWNNLSTQMMGKASFWLGMLVLYLGKTAFQTGGIYMEMFLRRNFGTRYFPFVFSIFTTSALGWGLFSSGSAVLFSVLDPGSLLSSLSLLIASVIFSIPWAIHSVSILRRATDTSGHHSQYSGDAWLDDLNEWVQRRQDASLDHFKKPLAWLCADTLRRDFLGETVAGIAIAYAVGLLCFDLSVTNFLLGSLALMQLKRACAWLHGLRERQKWNDAQKEMERRGNR